MAKSDKPKSGNAAGVLGVAIGLLSAAAPIVTTIVDKLPAKSEDEKATQSIVAVPNLCMKGFPLTVEQAREKLSSEGFKMMANEIALKNAHPKYRHCSDLQVVDYAPKGKARPGTMIDVRYATQELIDKSQKLFEEQEVRKTELKAKRTCNRQRRIEQVREGAKRVFLNHKSKEE